MVLFVRSCLSYAPSKLLGTLLYTIASCDVKLGSAYLIEVTWLLDARAADADGPLDWEYHIRYCVIRRATVDTDRRWLIGIIKCGMRRYGSGVILECMRTEHPGGGWRRRCPLPWLLSSKELQFSSSSWLYFVNVILPSVFLLLWGNWLSYEPRLLTAERTSKYYESSGQQCYSSTRLGSSFGDLATFDIPSKMLLPRADSCTDKFIMMCLNLVMVSSRW